MSYGSMMDSWVNQKHLQNDCDIEMSLFWLFSPFLNLLIRNYPDVDHPRRLSYESAASDNVERRLVYKSYKHNWKEYNMEPNEVSLAYRNCDPCENPIAL